MDRYLKILLGSFALIVLLWTRSASAADENDKLAGKWSVKKVNEQGESYSQTLEIKKDKFIFQLLGADGQAAIYAEGDFKAEKLGPFKTAHFFHIRGGNSPSNLDDVDDEYTLVYVLDGDSWSVAANFDKDRGQKPAVDVYKRVKSETATLVIDEIEMADTPQSGTWFLCFEAKADDASGRYYLENKGYDKNQVAIPLTLELPKVRAGQKCSFKLQLDDVDGDACGNEPDNRSTGEFTVTQNGSQTYKPEDHWRYTIRWHLK